ncbi:MAG TPA: hypothetical protein VKI44_29870 [Acetobacteraceae bacterium]|nr:hypothetical protein [Acetobacteraceae bacterium]
MSAAYCCNGLSALPYVIVGDNGASAEGTLQGAFNEMANFNGMADMETVASE